MTEMNTSSLKAAWQSFRDSCLLGSDEEGLQLARKVFYAGACALHYCMVDRLDDNNTSDSPTLDEEARVFAVLSEVTSVSEAFAEGRDPFNGDPP